MLRMSWRSLSIWTHSRQVLGRPTWFPVTNEEAIAVFHATAAAVALSAQAHVACRFDTTTQRADYSDG